MFNIGATELILILSVALVVFGPGKLPELGQTLGKTIRAFKTALNNMDEDIKQEVGDIRQEVEDVKEAADMRATVEEIQNDLKAAMQVDLPSETDAPAPEAEAGQAAADADTAAEVRAAEEIQNDLKTAMRVDLPSETDAPAPEAEAGQAAADADTAAEVRATLEKIQNNLKNAEQVDSPSEADSPTPAAAAQPDTDADLRVEGQTR